MWHKGGSGMNASSSLLALPIQSSKGDQQEAAEALFPSELKQWLVVAQIY